MKRLLGMFFMVSMLFVLDVVAMERGEGAAEIPADQGKAPSLRQQREARQRQAAIQRQQARMGQRPEAARNLNPEFDVEAQERGEGAAQRGQYF